MTAWERLEARVRDYANRHGIKPGELAERLGYDDRSSGSLFKSGKRGFGPDRLERVAELLGTSVMDLFAEELAPLSPEAIEVAKAFESADPKSRKIVRVALGLELKVKPVRKETLDDQGARPGRRTARRR